MYVPSTEDIRTLYSHNIELYTRIDLLNDRMKTIDSLQGITTEGRISVDADADIRRTYTSTIVLDEKHAISQYSESEWMNKYVWIYIGVKTPMLDDIIWYSQGVYVFSQNGYNYDTQTRSLTINCMDLTAMLNDTLAGQLTGIKTVFKAGGGIRRAMVELLQEVGINKVFVEYWNRTIPYDQEFDAATSVWTILTQLRDLYYPFEIFFEDDVFKCQQIPSCEDDPLVLNADVFNDLIISEDATVDYSEVRNCVEVFGAAASPDVSCTDLVVDTTKKTMTLNVIGLALSGKKLILFTPPDNVADLYNADKGYQMKISAKATESSDAVVTDVLSLYTISTDEAGNNKKAKQDCMKPKVQYVVRYDADYSPNENGGKGRFYFYGQVQPHAMVMLKETKPSEEELDKLKETENCQNLEVVSTANPDIEGYEEDDQFLNSPFSIERIGRRNVVLSGGEYDNYTTDDGILDVAEYELWKRARLTDSITVKMLLVPWLDVNTKVEYCQHLVRQSSCGSQLGSPNAAAVSKIYNVSPRIVLKNHPLPSTNRTVTQFLCAAVGVAGHVFAIDHQSVPVTERRGKICFAVGCVAVTAAALACQGMGPAAVTVAVFMDHHVGVKLAINDVIHRSGIVLFQCSNRMFHMVNERRFNNVFAQAAVLAHVIAGLGILAVCQVLGGLGCRCGLAAITKT